MIKDIFKQFIGDITLGRIDYYRFKKQRNSWGGPFNGQIFRQEIFKKILSNIQFDAIVETGTFKGTTTEHLQIISGLPTFSVECLPRNYGFAHQRFKNNNNIHLSLGDSRDFIESLKTNNDLANHCVFFYLDAHWFDDLPLLDEIHLIFNNWTQSVVMIDDFKVPDDAGYNYDNYGEGKEISIDYIRQNEPNNLSCFFPTLDAKNESGAKRGCAILTCNDAYLQILCGIQELRLLKRDEAIN